MFCSKCGAEVKEGYKFCPKCGAPLPSTPPALGKEGTPAAEAKPPPLKSTAPGPAPQSHPEQATQSHPEQATQSHPEQATQSHPEQATQPSAPAAAKKEGKPTVKPAHTAASKPLPKASSKAAAVTSPAPPKPPATTPEQDPSIAPAPPKPPGPPAPKPDVKDIVKSPLRVMAVEGAVDFKAAEHALDSEGLKLNAFSGIFGRPKPTEVRVDSLTKVYEPIHMVRAVYEGTFKVAKDFTLQLDKDTVNVEIDGKSHGVKQVAQPGGIFSSSSSPSLKIVGNQTIKKRVEKVNYYDLNGVQKNQIEQYVKGKKTVSFDPAEVPPRSQVLGTNFDPSGLADRLLTPDIVQRPHNASKTVKEGIKVDIQTIYYPKYKALITNLKNSQQKYLFFSAVNKTMFQSETF